MAKDAANARGSGPRAYSIPHLLQIELTYVCNFRCVFCYNPERDGKVDYAKLEHIVRRIREAHIPHVYLMGGEPSCLDHSFVCRMAELLVPGSSVTLVTNGYLPIRGLPEKMACIGVPLHGPAEVHDKMTSRKGAFDHALRAIRYYRSRGHPVRIIPVLSQLNYEHIWDVARIAAAEGCAAVYVDRYEDGGVGSANSRMLKPSLDATRQAITQMIRAQEEFGILTTFGTAVPFCLDSRIRAYRLAKDCGAGFSFASVNPSGDLRACNQSPRVFGNVLDREVAEIWNGEQLNEFRELRWVTAPCLSCLDLGDCFCGCKVDLSSRQDFTIDYAVRDHGLSAPRSTLRLSSYHDVIVSKSYRTFRPGPLSRINDTHAETFLVTRYQTVELSPDVIPLVEDALRGPFDEGDFVARHIPALDESATRTLLSLMEKAGAFE